MSGAEVFSDEELTAWLDGEADDALRARIDAAAGPALDARLAELRLDVDALRAAFDGVLTAAPVAPPTPAAAQTPPPRRRWMAAAAIGALCAALGALGVNSFRADPLNDWRGYAAAYHRLYVEDTLASATNPAASEAALDRVGAKLRKPLAATATASPDLTFRRAQVLGFEDAPLAQIAFTTADGAPVALCILARPGASERPIEAVTLFDMAGARWASADYEYLLIGDVDAAVIERAAAAFRARL